MNIISISPQTARFIRVKDQFDFSDLSGLAEVCGDEQIAEDIHKAANSSMGQDIVELDMLNIDNFAEQGRMHRSENLVCSSLVACSEKSF